MLYLTGSGHVFAGADGLEADEGDLHGEQQPEDVEGGVAGEQSVRVATHDEQSEHVQRDQIDDEHVASPRRHLE